MLARKVECTGVGGVGWGASQTEPMAGTRAEKQNAQGATNHAGK